MSAKEEIVYIDPFSKVIIKTDKNSFKPIINIKKYFIGSRVEFEDIITYSFKVHNSISKEELDIQVELKMYEDAGLKTDKQYKIDYIKKELDYEESLIIEVFAIDIEEIKPKLSFIFEHTKRLDFLALPNLSFQSLYNNKILSPQKDIFIYFDENEAFMAIYKNGKYLSSSSLNTLNEIVKELQSNISDTISIKSLREILKEKGLDAKRYDDSEITLYNALHSIFEKIFNKINNIAMHNRSIFGFDTVERIFFSTVDGRIRGLREFLKTIDLENVELRDFNLFKQKSEKQFLEHIIASYILYKKKGNDWTNNVTFLKKSKPFLKTRIGSFGLFLIFAFLIFGAYPIYLFLQNTNLVKEKNNLQNRYEIVQNKTRNIKRKIDKSKINIEKIDNAIKKQKIEFSNLNKGINELILLTSNRNKSYATILLINKYLEKYNLSLESYKQKQNNHIILNIIAQYNKRDDIAKFMKDLIDRGFIKVSTKEIKLSKDYYISKIEIKK